LNRKEIKAMQQVTWFIVAWVGGSSAILGSLMTLGSLLLWLVPLSASKTSKVSKAHEERSLEVPIWQNRVKLLVVSLGLAIAGLSLLVVFPLPLH
jgi:hypothetical protein